MTISESIEQLLASSSPPPYCNEERLREYTDEPARRMLRMWHEACLGQTDIDVEVIVLDLGSIPAALNAAGMATLLRYRSLPTLAILTREYPSVPSMILSHEIGHMVLCVGEGFREYDRQDKKDRVDEATEGMLNSLATHPRLYELQRRCGHEPQGHIDECAAKRVDEIHSGQEPTERRNRIGLALINTDALLNCSAGQKRALSDALAGERPHVYKHVGVILDTVAHYELHSPAENLKCMQRIVKNLCLDGRWLVSEPMASHIASLVE